MKNYNYISVLVFFVAMIIAPSDAFCYKFPAAYTPKLNKPIDNADEIIKCLVSTATGSETAQNDEKRIEKLKENIATSLYAQALASRVKIAKLAAKKAKDAAAGAIAGLSSVPNSRQILQEKVLEQAISVAKRLNDIVALEAGVADLEGTIIITGLPKGDTSFLDKKEEDVK